MIEYENHNGNGTALAERPDQSQVPARNSSRAEAIQVNRRGIVPETMADLWILAQRVAASGLAPKDMQRPETIFIALEMGLELGLPMMASLRNIAVINGRPAIWGDAALALVQSTGLLEDYDEFVEGEGDHMVATVSSKRKGRSRPVVTRFSAQDAKTAGLWGKSGPWQQYRARMLKLRARGFNLRDNFPDVLQGMYTAEEAGDLPAETAAPIVKADAKPLAERVAARRRSESQPSAPVAPAPTVVSPVPSQPASAPTSPEASTAPSDTDAQVQADEGGDGAEPDVDEVQPEAPEAAGIPDHARADAKHSWIDDLITTHKPDGWTAHQARKVFHAADLVDWSKLPRERQDEKHGQLVAGAFPFKK